MKKSLISMLMTIFLMSAASAQAEYVSMQEVCAQAGEMGRWTKTYEAHGRTFAVDVPIVVPEASWWGARPARGGGSNRRGRGRLLRGREQPNRFG